jgi:hypothetical protein
MLFEQSAYRTTFSERREGSAMAHREPKKDKGSTKAQSNKWAVSEVVEAQTSSKH